MAPPPQPRPKLLVLGVWGGSNWEYYTGKPSRNVQVHRIMPISLYFSFASFLSCMVFLYLLHSRASITEAFVTGKGRDESGGT